jgi:hypothetical protein
MSSQKYKNENDSSKMHKNKHESFIQVGSKALSEL